VVADVEGGGVICEFPRMIFDIPARYAREMRGMICAFYVHMLGCGVRAHSRMRSSDFKRHL
jgi:hypothetical protein